MRFADAEQVGRLADGGWLHGVLRVGRHVAWQCWHEHDTRAGAVACAYHAEYLATLAGLLPEPPQASWLDGPHPRPGRRARRAAGAA